MWKSSLSLSSCSRCLGWSGKTGILGLRALLTEYVATADIARWQSTVDSQVAPTKPRKAPLSAYQIFVKEKLGNKTIGSGTVVESLRKVAVEWQSLTDDEKEPYYERSDIEKDSWYKECARYESYLGSLTEVQRMRIKLKELLLKADARERRKLSKGAADDVALRMPKRPGSIFQLFIKEELRKGSFEGLKGPELFLAAGEKWKTLSENKKDELKMQRKELQEKYFQDLEAWKKN